MNKRIFFANKIRLLTQTLLFSIVLNCAFLVIFFYFFIRENPFPIQFSYLPHASPKENFLTNNAMLSILEKQPFEKLATHLIDERLVEEGVKVQDLSLALLVKEHKLDIHRALGRTVIPERIALREGKEPLPLFSELRKEEFCHLFHFAHSERWPFTFEPLFAKIKEKANDSDSALLQMFFQSEEFLLVERVFKSSAFPLQRKILFSLCLEANYLTLKKWVEEQKITLDLSEKNRRDFLVQLIRDKSATAALLLIYSDMAYAVHHLDEPTLLQLLHLIPKNNPKSVLLAEQLSHSLHNRQVIAKAREFLPKEVSGKFESSPTIGTLRPAFRARPPAALSPASHIVQPGDSLWSIAKKYNLTVDELTRLNKLTSSNLQTGKILKVH